MANIKMCDFCGKVSNQMAAEVLIRPVDMNADVFKDANAIKYDPRIDASVRDACHDCVKQFMQVRELKILEATGDL